MTKHGYCCGGKNDNLYSLWVTMRCRCRNPGDRNKWHNGRGITVCDRWNDPENGFENFVSDMGPRPSKRYSIDRIDTNGHYEPGNCRWATMKEQHRNRTDNKNITYNGKTQCVAAWSEELGIPSSTIWNRLLRNKPVDVVLSVNKFKHSLSFKQGQVFGNLEIIGEADPSPSGKRRYHCWCRNCNSPTISEAYSLKLRNQKYCRHCKGQSLLKSRRKTK